MSILDKIKNAVFEEDLAPKTDSEKPPSQTSFVQGTLENIQRPQFTTGLSVPSTTIAAEQISTEQTANNGAYVKIKEKVDFTKTATFELLQKYLAPMASSAIPETVKYQLALAQIKSIEGVDAIKLLATFDGLQTKLQREAEAFTDYVASTFDAQVKPLEEKVNSLTQEINDLQTAMIDKTNQLSLVSGKKSDAEAKIEKGKSQFAIAVKIISNEIEGDRAKYTSLLQAK